jgi:hypothetical protein
LGRLDGEADPHDLQGLVEACVRSLRDTAGREGLFL